MDIHDDNIDTCQSEMAYTSDADSVELRKKDSKKYVSYECGHILFSSSFQLLMPILFSLYCKLYLMTLIDVFLFITSVVHWRKPELGIRRDSDMFMVLINTIAKGLFAFTTNSLCVFIYACGFISTITLYWIGQRLSYNEYSTLFHLSMHSIGIFATLNLYYFSKEFSIDII
ncbi:conserved protein, unknown function [Plasmodium chabaudi chabaudi]|uniref:Uncharacterized protein n=1 Tax=Plasmodium chabaudi chabaudi TaxID=31271 RepID=A0A4V6M9J6_PLACU|nr:conserved protein, unknown function [Plasmodium chabaudi chabaudi]VTZ69695.1 conserved protein, unknown function [Plasmodium chabaudi chabaudi]|eukprot:XP_744430.2 conserved Plasmodium protein, unknown function [Plasmodium chabaudi chabaudi]